MKFNTYLEEFRKEFEPIFTSVLSTWKGEVIKENALLAPVIEEFVNQSQGGKRIRAALVKLGYELAGGEANNKDILAPAAAMEIFQTSILSHDDIIDKSTLRRGKPSLYEKLGGDHYGISQTISLGGLGFFLCMQILSESRFPEHAKTNALVFFTKAAQKTALGQMRDVAHDPDILQVAFIKTAYYSFITPLTLGAFYANTTEKLLKNLYIFGKNAGIAYQIYDDILGVFGNNVTGKSNTSDITDGKKTLLIFYAKEKAGEKEKKILDSLYGKPDLSASEQEKIKEIIEKTGARDLAEKKAEEYLGLAQEAISNITPSQELRSVLSDLLLYLKERKK